LLVEALPQMPTRAKLLLDMFKNFDPGSYAAKLLDRAEELGVRDRIVTIDVAHSQIPRYMNCCDVVVLPSLTSDRWKEQFGRVLPEAMACGVAVIGSASGNIPDMIGDAGVIVPEGSPSAIATAVTALASDPDRRQLLQRAGRQRVEALFSVEAQVSQMRALFTEAGVAT
jgi:glycosyltransferase involved in cell wall biosynthesis